MRLRAVTIGSIIFLTMSSGALVGCSNAREELESAREDLEKTQARATERVIDAQAKAAREINRVKEDSAEKIADAQERVRRAEDRVARINERYGGSESAATSDGEDSSNGVTFERCQALAQENAINLAHKDLYEECAKLKSSKK